MKQWATKLVDIAREVAYGAVAIPLVALIFALGHHGADAHEELVEEYYEDERRE